MVKLHWRRRLHIDALVLDLFYGVQGKFLKIFRGRPRIDTRLGARLRCGRRMGREGGEPREPRITQRGSAATEVLTTDPPTPRLRRDRLDGWHGWFPSRKELNRTDGPRNTRRKRAKQISSPKLSSLFAYLVGKISYSWRAENLRKTRRISPIAVRISRMGQGG